MKRIIFCLVLIVSLFRLPVRAADPKWEWHDPQIERNGGASNVWNQGWDEKNYCRLPQSAESEVRKPVWNLSRHSAGLMIKFLTDADVIRVRYGVSGGFSMNHMPSTGVSGVDLYRLNPDGSDSFCAGNYNFSDTVSYSFTVDLKPSAAQQEYALYLPTYNNVKWMEIGVKEGNSFKFIPADKETRPIVIYGTSITQGACSSRPGMAWTNVVNRRLHYPVVNLGFSGNGRLETPLIKNILDLNPSVIVLDCLPNLDTWKREDVRQHLLDAVHQIRKSTDAPILFVDHAGYSNDETNTARHKSYNSLNDTQAGAYNELKKEGVKNLHYLSRKEIALDPDSWVDVVHYTDLGMLRLGDVATKKLRKIVFNSCHP